MSETPINIEILKDPTSCSECRGEHDCRGCTAVRTEESRDALLKLLNVEPREVHLDTAIPLTGDSPDACEGCTSPIDCARCPSRLERDSQTAFIEGLQDL